MKKKDRISLQQFETFLSNCTEEKEGNDIIQRFRHGPTEHSRQEWIVYFYTACTDETIIEEECLKLFGGRNEEDAVGYVGAYTLLTKLEKYKLAYRAGYNYSFEQMRANYD